MMYIIWWIRSWFCSHLWKFEEKNYKFSERDDLGYLHTVKEGPKVSATCTKCGWHRSYWKF